MFKQSDPSPWTSQSHSEHDNMLRSGRGHFAELGVVRRKPSRSDAPATLSKSCSDKLALKQCTSLLSALTSLLVHPGNAYLHSLCLPHGQILPAALKRAFSSEGRMAPILNDPSFQYPQVGGYVFRPFVIKSHDTKFQYSKPSTDSENGSRSCNITAVWTPTLFEALIGGNKQGSKQFSPDTWSALSRVSLWMVVRCLSQQSEVQKLVPVPSLNCDYGSLKNCPQLQARKKTKGNVQRMALFPWTRNTGDDAFTMPTKPDGKTQGVCAPESGDLYACCNHTSVRTQSSFPANSS